MQKENTQEDIEGTMEGVFVNTYVHSLDTKKRLTIPREWREMVGVPEQLFVLPGVNDKCLYVYPAREMTRRMQRLQNLSIADRKGKQFKRTLASRTYFSGWDTQGRIRIKDELLNYAELINQVVLVGSLDGFELWNPDQWNEINTSMDQESFGEAAQYVGF